MIESCNCLSIVRFVRVLCVDWTSFGLVFTFFFFLEEVRVFQRRSSATWAVAI